jgi:hypothetical protein
VIKTVEYKGKIFAVECACEERGGHEFSDRVSEFGFSGIECAVQDTQCPNCDLFPWIILPITEKAK